MQLISNKPRIELNLPLKEPLLALCNTAILIIIHDIPLIHIST